jgi:uroporphyrinogen-III synthase
MAEQRKEHIDLKVKSILVSQPKPEGDKSPYFDLAEKYKLKIDFRPFIHVEGVPALEFRKQRINFLEFGSVIFTSRNAVDHYFRMANENRITIPDTMKYFCLSESTAFYLQKYVVYRKRKIFYGKQTIQDLVDVMKKHKEDNFLLPSSDILKDSIPEVLEKYKFKFTIATLYRTVCSDLSDLSDVYYDMLAFFSPGGIKSLFENFPDFKQNNTRIAVFGPTTKQAAEEAGLFVDVPAPTKDAPSMTMALEDYIKKANRNR